MPKPHKNERPKWRPTLYKIKGLELYKVRASRTCTLVKKKLLVEAMEEETGYGPSSRHLQPQSCNLYHFNLTFLRYQDYILVIKA
ncbi:hypothetical protein CKAN_00229600 [Cinnamomum micranthum f. kanehirae]|uniref:Uncharacterized protein n=1 Tax=Cinnamomum micranthum f. kanehirae TaxID=337451 RepID=A0A3S3PV06_9MAGN|nr:hypothetical protein CKAN_00229600 [Cinnamomum micranthum f. kanehirae]